MKLRGLQGKAERNGQVGVINSHATESGRYTVQLRDGTLLALRRQNLLQMVSVRLTGLDGEQSRHNAEVRISPVGPNFAEPRTEPRTEPRRATDRTPPSPVGLASRGFVWSGVARCGRVRSGAVGCGRVWSGVVGYGRVWSGGI